MFKDSGDLRVGVSRGNTGVTEFTVWTGWPLFLTISDNIRETPIKWEVLACQSEKMFLTLANGR